MLQRLTAFGKKFFALLTKTQPLALLLARVTIGITFAQTGWGKLHSLDQVTEYFRSLGIPAAEIQAPFVASVEFICGSLILVGFATRLASFPLVGTMVVAILTAKIQDLMTWTDLFGFIEFLYVVILVTLITQGPGLFSLDHLFSKKMRKI